MLCGSVSLCESHVADRLLDSQNSPCSFILDDGDMDKNMPADAGGTVIHEEEAEPIIAGEFGVVCVMPIFSMLKIGGAPLNLSYAIDYHGHFGIVVFAGDEMGPTLQ